ncbi:hypothetical protein BDN67DRAFT_1004531 [Paxillus ammoniavirescens]|nr:hypothetical protein BDN67DRAFT_1004531 [Paxillus ammoniavirescens]
MVQTRSSAKKRESGVNDSGDSNIQEMVNSASDFQSGRKRQMRQKGKECKAEESSKRSKLRGKLEMMPDMNLDILFHILGFLRPMDLLNLARTSKAFRRLLMHKSSAFAWKTARLQIEGLPECPQDLSEPQYANLVFWPHCHNCGKTAPAIYWRIRRSVLGGEILEYPTQRKYSVFFDQDQLDKFLEKYNDVPEDERDEFLKVKRKQLDIVLEHASRCDEWHREVTTERRLELQNVREEREESIFTRLRDLGYKDEIRFVGKFEIRMLEDAFFRKSKPLTDKEWNRVFPRMQEKMDDIRLHLIEETVYGRRREVLVELYEDYVSRSAPPGAAFDILPHVADVATFPLFDAVIHAPQDSDITRDSFSAAFLEFPSFVRSWIRAKQSQLSTLVVLPKESFPARRFATNVNLTPVERLKLASAVFVSNWNGNVMMYPDVLYFVEFNRIHFDTPFSFWRKLIPFEEITARVFGAYPWSLVDSDGNNLIELFTPAAFVVLACGLDPRTATCDDMDERDARLTCKYCPDKVPKARTWKNAVLFKEKRNISHAADNPQQIVHAYHAHRDEWGGDFDKTQWTLVEDAYLDKVRTVEQGLKYSAARPESLYACAGGCQRRIGDFGSFEDIEEHAIETHDASVKDLDRYVYADAIETAFTKVVPEVTIKGNKVPRIESDRYRKVLGMD